MQLHRPSPHPALSPKGPNESIGSIGDLDRAMARLESNWSPITHYLHGVGALRDSISLEENLLFALLLMRSHRMQRVLRARQLIQRILYWQISIGPAAGLFPRHLHNYPRPGPISWHKWIAGLLILILKAEPTTCGEALQRSIARSLRSLLPALKCDEKGDCFEKGIFAIATNWFDQFGPFPCESEAEFKKITEKVTAEKATTDCEWPLGPEQLAIFSLFASEFDQRAAQHLKGKLHSWHCASKSWLGLLRRNVLGCLRPLDPLYALLEPNWPNAMVSPSDLHRLSLLRALSPGDRSSAFKDLDRRLNENLFPASHGHFIDQGRGALSFSTDLWAGTCLRCPTFNESNLAKVWDFARFIWGKGRQKGSCRLQIDAHRWLQEPELCSSNRGLGLKGEILAAVSSGFNESPFQLLCSEQRGDRWTVMGQRTTIFRSGDLLKYSDDLINLTLKISTDMPSSEWLGHIRPAKNSENSCDIEYWRISIKPLATLKELIIRFEFEIAGTYH